MGYKYKIDANGNYFFIRYKQKGLFSFMRKWQHTFYPYYCLKEVNLFIKRHIKYSNFVINNESDLEKIGD